jgi:hypothetical protein
LNRGFKLSKRSQLFIRTRNETVAAVAAIVVVSIVRSTGGIQIALSNSKKAVSFSSARTTKRFPIVGMSSASYTRSNGPLAQGLTPNGCSKAFSGQSRRKDIGCAPLEPQR